MTTEQIQMRTCHLQIDICHFFKKKHKKAYSLKLQAFDISKLF